MYRTLPKVTAKTKPYNNPAIEHSPPEGKLNYSIYDG
jgi:hypothetical protein